MYTYNEKSLSKTEISMVPEKTQMNQTDSLHFQTSLKFKEYDKPYINCSLEFSSQFKKYFDWLTGQVFKLALIFQRTV